MLTTQNSGRVFGVCSGLLVDCCTCLEGYRTAAPYVEGEESAGRGAKLLLLLLKNKGQTGRP